jgi:dienelactone hydrolase
MADDLADFTASDVTFGGVTHPVYRSGEGPCVLVLAEIPGITPKVADFARRLVALGCSVALPSLFGTPGKEPSNGYALSSVVNGCVSKEFVVFARGRTAPVTDWLRALARAEHERCGGPGVGVVGMCFTGGFALGMLAEPAVLAPVLSQPSLPIGTAKAKRDLGISDADLAAGRDRVDAEDICVLGLRFTGDKMSPPERFERLRAEFGENFVGVEIDSSPGNVHHIRKLAHSVLTEDLVDEPGHPTRDALDTVLDLFRTRLLA